MQATCRRCGRLNPAEASYCYFDGICLEAGADAPRDLATSPFPAPFQFLTGEPCSNFDQLALVCQAHVPETWTLLRDGLFAPFLSAIGRLDLVKAAEEAVAEGDPDLAVDYFLARVPTKNLPPPKLTVSRTDWDLGTLDPGTDCTLEIRLSNAGGRLISGSIHSDCGWLTVDDAEAGQLRLLKFWNEHAVHVRVIRSKLPASQKPHQAQVFLETSGGAARINIECAVPITPFALPPFTGCRTPREIAVAAKQHPKEAASLFSQGAISNWYRQNGWIYPVKGTSASGVAAVQQFFEALGLVKAPDVVLDTPSLQFRGRPGEKVRQSVRLHTDDNRYVFAFATSPSPWLSCETVTSTGNRASIIVEAILPPADQPFQSHIDVCSNGSQRFRIPVDLQSEPEFSDAPEASGTSETESHVVRESSRGVALRRGIAIAAALLGICLVAGALFYWQTIAVGATPLSPYRALIGPDTVFVAHLDVTALQKNQRSRPFARGLEERLFKSLGELELQPAHPSLSSVFLAYGATGLPVVAFTFSEPLVVASTTSGRYVKRGRVGSLLFEDRAQPETAWVVDESGRLLVGPAADIEASLKRHRQQSEAPAFPELQRWAGALPQQPALWAVASFGKHSSCEAVPFLSGNEDERVRGFQVWGGEDGSRGLVLRVGAEFPSMQAASACRERLRGNPCNSHFGSFDALDWQELWRRASWEHRESEVTVDVPLDEPLWAKLYCSLTDSWALEEQRVEEQVQKLCMAEAEPGLAALQAKDYPKAAALLEHVAFRFPRSKQIQSSLEQARRSLKDQQTFADDLESCRAALKAGNLDRAKSLVEALRKAHPSDEQVASLQQEFDGQERSVQCRKQIEEGEAALRRLDLERAVLCYQQVAVLDVGDSKGKEAEKAVSTLRAVKRCIDQGKQHLHAKPPASIERARNQVVEAAKLIASVKALPGAESAAIRDCRARILQDAKALSQDLSAAYRKRADDAAGEGDELASQAKYGEAAKSYEQAKRDLRQARELVLQLPLLLRKGSPPSGAIAELDARDAELAKAVSKVQGRGSLSIGKETLSAAQDEAEKMRSNPALLRGVGQKLRTAIAALKEADRQGRAEAAPLLKEASALQDRARTLLCPFAVDFEKENIPGGWAIDKKRWQVGSDRDGQKWLWAPESKAASFTTRLHEWPADFTLTIEFALVRESIDNSLWAYNADPIVIGLVTDGGLSEDLILALGKDPSLMEAYPRLQFNRKTMTADRLLKAKEPITFEVTCRKGMAELSVNGKSVATDSLKSGISGLRLRVVNPYHPTLQRFMGTVALRRIEVRALVVDDDTKR